MSVGKIQRPPRGLLQFLGMVGSGVSPTLVNDEVHAEFPIIPFLGSGIFSSQQVNGSVTNPGDTVVIPVPAGVGWYMIGAQYGCVAALGETASCSLRLLMPNSPTPAAVRIDTFPLRTAVNANASFFEGVLFPQPFVLLPGAELQVILDDGTLAAARTAAVTGIFYRFEV